MKDTGHGKTLIEGHQAKLRCLLASLSLRITTVEMYQKDPEVLDR